MTGVLLATVWVVLVTELVSSRLKKKTNTHINVAKLSTKRLDGETNYALLYTIS